MLLERNNPLLTEQTVYQTHFISLVQNMRWQTLAQNHLPDHLNPSMQTTLARMSSFAVVSQVKELFLMRYRLGLLWQIA
jgi:hypothetical protein